MQVMKLLMQKRKRDLGLHCIDCWTFRIWKIWLPSAVICSEKERAGGGQLWLTGALWKLQAGHMLCLSAIFRSQLPLWTWACLMHKDTHRRIEALKYIYTCKPGFSPRPMGCVYVWRGWTVFHTLPFKRASLSVSRHDEIGSQIYTE